MVPLLLLPLLWGGSLQELLGYELRVQESVVVKACMDVHVPCSFSYPWYYSGELFIYWFREKDHHTNDAVATNDRKKPVKPETQGRFSLLGNPSNNDCSLSIREARLSDSGVYYFRVEKGPTLKHSYREKKLNLQVTGEKPDIHFLEPLESGRPTKLTCRLSLACDEPHPLLFSWVGDAFDAMKPDTLHSSELTLTPRPQDHGTNLTCLVTLQGSQVALERTIWLNVSYAPRNLRISLSFRNVTAFKILQNTSSILISEGQELQLLCVADSNPPAQLSWFRGSPALEATPISSTGVLELPCVGAAEEGEFTCRAQNPLDFQNIFLSLIVVWKPAFLVVGALGGAGAMALLSLCLCFLFFYILKARRKQAAMRPEGVDDEDPVMGTVAWGSRKKPCSDSPPDQMVLSPAEDAPPPGEQEDLHYASLNFHEMTSREPQDQEATSTEYSEIKTS
ncbi:sialic acid-binding Ig-like lectin 14 isoform X4 [Bos taurus]|uniref:sialic acid-binding Ig-like lectin 14 isoform X4 n=1 Tax=Bos taurus TaxID=9913 RepID=UPI0028CB5C25|nr:sialic acid-binding Ig-like lectin 14 isoform X4 [Bos taurus]